MIHEAKHRDKVVIPDRYNTGVQIPQSALIPIEQKVSGWNGYIQPSNIAQICDANYVCNGVSFVGTVAFKTSVAHGITFKNCKFDANGSTYCMSVSGSWTDSLYWHFENCEFVNFGSASVQTHDNLVFKNCQFHHGNADGVKGGFSNGGYENCLIYDLGRGEGDIHADGLQTTGYQKDFYVKNCRFDLPCTSENKSNACIFFTQEMDAIDCVVEDVMMFGGGYTFYLGIKEGHEATITNLSGSNIKIGYGEHFGIFNCTLEEYSGWRTDGTITRQDQLFVSSVLNASDGSVKIHATNYTNEDRTLVVVTDVDTYTFTVEGNLSYDDGHTLTWEDYHFDDEFTVYGNYVICYDTSVADANEIRFAQTSVAELFTEIGDAIRTKKGESDLYARVALPYEISTIQGGVAPSGTIEITANGTYDVSTYASAHVNLEAFHLTSISATKTVTEYEEGDTLDLTDISVVASYSNASTKDVSDSATINADDVDMDTAGTYSIGVSYTEDGVTVTTTISITVASASQETLVYSNDNWDGQRVAIQLRSADEENLPIGTQIHFVGDYEAELDANDNTALYVGIIFTNYGVFNTNTDIFRYQHAKNAPATTVTRHIDEYISTIAEGKGIRPSEMRATSDKVISQSYTNIRIYLVTEPTV